jgi:DNA-binding winged helix-turn-helix (wHTH) protein/TolB-like protein
LGDSRVYRFDNYTLEVEEHRLKRGGVEISLAPKAFETLVYLIERHDHLVKKSELLDAVWADVTVTEGALTLRIKEIRQALEDDAQRPRYIKTIPTVGYKFIGSVAKTPSTDSEVETSRPENPTETMGTARPHPVSLRFPRKAYLALTVAVTLIGFAFVVYLSLSPSHISDALSVKSIAVIPFRPLVAKDRDEALELGMAESLIAKLNNFQKLAVTPLNAVRNYTSLEQDPVSAGQALQVETVLDGSIQRSGERIRVMVRLVRVKDKTHLWTGQFDETFTSVFDVQDTISEKVVEALALKLTGDELVLLTKRYTQNSEAYQAYYLGRYFWDQGTEEGLRKGIAYFEQALEKDPNYALARTGLADSYILLGSYGTVSMAESYQKARAEAEKALSIDEKLGEAHVSMASILADHYWEWTRAEKHYKRAIELIPNDQAAHNWYSQYLAAAGRFDEATRQAQLPLDIAPASRLSNHTLAFAFYFAGRYEDAIHQSKKTLELDENFPVAHALLGMAYLKSGVHDKAIFELQTARQRFDSPAFLALLGYARAVAGKTNEARETLDELQKLSTKRFVGAFPKAVVYAGLGERRLALDALERAFQERSPELGLLGVDPMFDYIRSDPQFVELLRSVGRTK